MGKGKRGLPWAHSSYFLHVQKHNVGVVDLEMTFKDNSQWFPLGSFCLFLALSAEKTHSE